MFSKEDILQVSKIKSMSDGDKVKGLLLIKDYKKRKTKTGGYFIDGTVEGLGSMGFKAWENSEAFNKLDVSDYNDTVASIFGKVNIFNGFFSIVIEDLNSVDLSGASITKESFFSSRYDGEQYFDATRKLLARLADNACVEIFDKVTENIKERFVLEFAAKSHHDNCRSGLIAHTYKCLYICKILALYPDIVKQQGGNISLIALGIAIHDIGKVFEYTNGSVINMGMIVSHHTFGVEILFGYKDFIVNKKGEDFFYRLCAIIEQHHGKFEESPRTIEAYIVHLIDNMESTLQLLNQELEGFQPGNQLFIDEFKLS